jgi:serine/threonine protein kinase
MDERHLIRPSNYEKLCSIGTGSLGKAYKVRNKQDQLLYVIKFVAQADPGVQPAIQRFFSLSHPALLPISGYAPAGKKHPFAIVSPFVPSGSLLHAQSLSDETKLKILFGVAEAMRYIESLGLSPRSLKPANVLLNDKLEPILCDYWLDVFFPGQAPQFSQLAAYSRLVTFVLGDVSESFQLLINECSDFESIVLRLLNSDPLLHLSADDADRYRRFQGEIVHPTFSSHILFTLLDRLSDATSFHTRLLTIVAEVSAKLDVLERQRTRATGIPHQRLVAIPGDVLEGDLPRVIRPLLAPELRRPHLKPNASDDLQFGAHPAPDTRRRGRMVSIPEDDTANAPTHPAAICPAERVLPRPKPDSGPPVPRPAPLPDPWPVGGGQIASARAVALARDQVIESRRFSNPVKFRRRRSDLIPTACSQSSAENRPSLDLSVDTDAPSESLSSPPLLTPDLQMRWNLQRPKSSHSPGPEAASPTPPGLPMTIRRANSETAGLAARECFPYEGNAFMGLFGQLTRQLGANLAALGIVTITGNSLSLSGATDMQRLVDFTWDGCWVSADEPNSWVQLDFGVRSVYITHYSLRTYHCARGYSHLKDWVAEGEKDGVVTTMDTRIDTKELNGRWHAANFMCHVPCDCRKFRIRQTGPNHHGDHYLILRSIELFGEIVSPDGQRGT